MRRNYHRSIFLIALTALCVTWASAQEKEEVERKRLAQLTFITPLGTNGIHSANTINKISINLIVGSSAGVEAFEFGGFHNTTRGDVRGVQVAGFGNVVTGTSRGFQMGGFYNVQLGLSTGMQAAGLANVIKGPSKGFQAAGITNIVSKESWAVQASGIANVTPGGNHGLQMAGFTNVNGKEGEGSQIAGLANVHYGKNARFQAAGFVNVATNGTRGTQIAGLLNYTRKLNGFQLALINVADTVERGVPLGLISVVKHGYYAFEVEANDAFWINATYKMGVPKLYNIFTVGFRQQDGEEMWGVGLGLGTIFSVGNNWGLNIDLTATHVNEGEWWTEELNLLNRLKVNGWFDIGPLQFFAGPSLNVYVSNLTNEEGLPGGNLIDPSVSFLRETSGQTQVLIYPGFNAGIRF